MLLVVAAHAWLGWELARYRPDASIAQLGSREPVPPDRLLLVLSFETRAPAAHGPATVQSSRRRRSLRAPMTAAAESATGRAEAGSDDVRPLDLRLPRGPDTLAARSDLFARAPALHFESTRFDRGWQSDGNLTHVAARRSKLAGLLLGALGALREPCTERQRREYDPACVPDQYRYAPGEE